MPRGRLDARCFTGAIGKLDTDCEEGRDLANGLRHLATSRISVRYRRFDAVAANIDTMMTDEYTALQKYISTYRDPNAMQEGDGEGEKKKKPWWKVCNVLSLPQF